MSDSLGEGRDSPNSPVPITSSNPPTINPATSSSNQDPPTHLNQASIASSNPLTPTQADIDDSFFFIPTPKTIQCIPEPVSLQTIKFIPIGQHHSLQTIGTPPAPPDNTQALCSSDKSIPDRFFSNVPINFVVDRSTHVVTCAHLDTGAWASVTPFQHILHDYKEFSDSFPSPI